MHLACITFMLTSLYFIAIINKECCIIFYLSPCQFMIQIDARIRHSTISCQECKRQLQTHARIVHKKVLLISRLFMNEEAAPVYFIHDAAFLRLDHL